MQKKFMIRTLAAIMLGAVLVTGSITVPVTGSIETAEAAGKGTKNVSHGHKPEKSVKKKAPTLPGFSVKYEKYKSPRKETVKTLVFSGEIKKEKELFLYRPGDKKPLEALQSRSNFETVKALTPLLFVGITDLSDKEQTALDRKLTEINTEKELLLAWEAGSKAGGDKKEARQAVKQYISGKFRSDKTLNAALKKELKENYGSLDKYTCSCRHVVNKNGTYRFYIATKDKKFKTKVFSVKVK